MPAAPSFDVLLSLDADGYVRQAKRVEAANSGIGVSSSRVGKSVGGMVPTFAKLGTVLAGLGLGKLAKDFAAASIEAGIFMQRSERALTVAVGSLEGARKEMGFVREEAKRLGLPIQESIEGFTKLSAAARGTKVEGQGVRDLFQAVGETATVLALSAQDVDGILRAFTQTLSKGKIQAEELRGQIGERLPGAFQIAADAMGVTAAELDGMMARGEITAEELLPRLSAELSRLFGDEALKAAQDANAQFNRLHNAAFLLRGEVGEQLAPAMGELAELLTDIASDEEILALFRALGEVSVDGVNLAIDVIRQLVADIEFLGGAIKTVEPLFTDLVEAIEIFEESVYGSGNTSREFIESLTSGFGGLKTSIKSFVASTVREFALLVDVIGSSTADLLGFFVDLLAIGEKGVRFALKLSQIPGPTFNPLATIALKEAVELLEGWGKGIKRTAVETQLATDDIVEGLYDTVDELLKAEESTEDLGDAAEDTGKRGKKSFDEMGDAAAAMRAKIEETQAFLKLTEATIEVTRQIAAFRQRTDDAGVAWDRLQTATKAGIDPALLSSKAVRDLVDRLSDANELWEGMQLLVRDTRGDIVDIVEQIADMAAEMEAAGESGIRFGLVSPDRVKLEALRMEMEDALTAAFDAASTTGGQIMLQRFGLTLDDLEAQIRTAFESEIYRLQVAVDLEQINAAIDEELGSLMESMGNDFLGGNGVSRFIERWGDEFVAAADAITLALDGIDGQLADTVHAAADLVAAFQAMEDANFGRAQVGQAAVAGAQMGAGIAQLGQQMGIFRGQPGSGEYGGELTGDYSAAGGTAGAVIGAAIAAYFTGGMGAGAGAAIGGVIGSVLGSFITSGADEAIATVTQMGDELQTRVDKAQGSMKPAILQLTSAVTGAIDDLEDALGAQITTGKFSFKIRDDVISVFINGIKAEFGTMQDAIKFAVTEILRTANFGEGIGENMRQVLEANSFEDLEQLTEGIGLAELLDRETAAARPLADAMQALTSQRSKEIRLAQQFGLAISDVLALTNERIQLTRDEVASINAQTLGVQNYLGMARSAQAAIEDFNAGLEREIASRQANVSMLEAERAQHAANLAAVQAEIEAAGGLQAVRTAALSEMMSQFGAFSGSVDGVSGSVDDAINGSDSLIRRLEAAEDGLVATAEQIAALGDSLAGLPDAIDAQAIADAWTIAGSRSAMQLIDLLQQVHGEQFMAGEEQRIQQQLYVMQLVASYQALQALIAASGGLFSVSQDFLDAVEATIEGLTNGELTLGRSGGRGGGRRQGRESAAATFRQEAEDVRAALDGATDSQIEYAATIRSLTEQAEEARLPLWELQQAIADIAALDLREISEPWRDAAQEAGEVNVETVLRQARERMEEALADALARAADNPEAYQAAVDAIAEGYAAEVGAIVTDVLVGLGDQALAMELQAAETAGTIQYLLDNLDALGLTAEQVAAAVLGGVLPGLLDIAAAEAERVGDIEALAEIQEQQARMERDMARLQFEAMVATLELAGAIDEELQALIDDTRARFGQDDYVPPDDEDDDPPGDDPRDPANLGTRIEALRRQTAEWSAALDQLAEDLVDGIVSQREYNEAVDDFGTERVLEFGAALFSFLDRYYETEGMHQQQRQALANLQWAYELAQLEIQFAYVHTLGILSDEALGFITETLGWIRSEGPPALAGLVDGVEQINRVAKDLVTTIGGVSTDDLRGIWDQLQDLLADSVGGIRGLLEDAIGGVAEIGDLTQQLRSAHPALLRSLAEDLGMTVQELLAALPTAADLAALEAAAIGDVLDDVLSEWEGGDSLADQLAEGLSVFEELAELAEEYGLDLTRIQAAQSVFLDEFFTQLRGGVQSLYDELTTGPRSTTPVFSQLQTAQQDFLDIVEAALGGDLDAIDQADEAAQLLLTLAEQFFAGGAGFGDVAALVQDLLGQILGMSPEDVIGDDLPFEPAAIQASDLITAPLTPDQILSALIGGGAPVSAIDLSGDMSRVTQAIERSAISRDARLDAMIYQQGRMISQGDSLLATFSGSARVA